MQSGRAEKQHLTGLTPLYGCRDTVVKRTLFASQNPRGSPQPSFSPVPHFFGLRSQPTTFVAAGDGGLLSPVRRGGEEGMKERGDPLGPIQSYKHTLSVAPAYLQQEDELWEPLDGPHHETVECHSVWTGILAQLRGRTAGSV